MARTEGICEHTEKRIFPNEFEAKLALSRSKRKRMNGDRRRREQRYYHCHKCGGYHLTSDPKPPEEMP